MTWKTSFTLPGRPNSDEAAEGYQAHLGQQVERAERVRLVRLGSYPVDLSELPKMLENVRAGIDRALGGSAEERDAREWEYGQEPGAQYGGSAKQYGVRVELSGGCAVASWPEPTLMKPARVLGCVGGQCDDSGRLCDKHVDVGFR